MKLGDRVGDYILDEELPGTSSERVFAATHRLLPRRAMVRVLRPTFAGLKAVAQAMMRESCILEKLRHVAVPRVFEAGVTDDKRPWLAIELVAGVPLRDSAPAVEDVVQMMRDVAAVLAHAHKAGIVHGGLTGDAILTCAGRVSTCVTRWSDARLHAGDADELADDVAALGAIAFEALLGQSVEDGGPRRWGGVPIRLMRLVERMLAKKVTATDVREECERIGAIEAVELATMPEEEEYEEVELVAVIEVDEPPVIPKPRWTPALGIKTEPGVHPTTRRPSRPKLRS